MLVSSYPGKAIIVMIVTVSEKGQVVIPASLRARLGISAGTRIEVTEDGGNLRLLVEPQRKTLSAAACIGVTGYIGPKIDLSDMDPARFASKL
jgi:AbrB family looped-hinge helix DNA binding protein